MPYERLQTAGFLFTQTKIAINLLSADYGDGFGPSALIGNPSGLRGWTVKIDVVPDSSDQVPLIGGKTRADYLWDFFVASKAAANKPFWLQDPKDDLLYLASFTDDELSYEILCSKVYSTGLPIRQRRVAGVASPIAEPTTPDVPVLNDLELGSVHVTTSATARVTSYLIKRKTGSGGSYSTIATVEVSSGAALDYVDTDVSLGNEYFYKVAAANLGGVSAESAEKSITVTPPPIVEYTFDEGAGQQVFNKAGSLTPSSNLFGIGERFFASQSRWASASCTGTPDFADGPTAFPGSRADRFQASASAGGYLYQIINRPSGELTMGLWVKSNTGSPQSMRMTQTNTGSLSGDLTVPTTWTLISWTETPGSGSSGVGFTQNAAGDALDILIYGAVYNTGAAPATYVQPEFNQIFGKNGSVESSLDPTWNSKGINLSGGKWTEGIPTVPVTFSEATIYMGFRANSLLTTYTPLIGTRYEATAGLRLDAKMPVGLTPKGEPSFLWLTEGAAGNVGTLGDGLGHVVAGSYDGATLRVFVDGNEVGINEAGVLAPVIVQRLQVGNIADAFGLDGDAEYVRIYDTAHTVSKIQTESVAIAAIMSGRGETMAGSDVIVFFEGDSITEAPGLNGYPLQVLRGISPIVQGRNHAVSGSGINGVAPSLDARATSVADAFANCVATTKVLSVLIGANDLQGLGASTFVARLKTRCLAYKAATAGLAICVIPVLPRTATGFNAERATANAAIGADPSFYDILVDVTGASMWLDATASDTTYFSDGTHPTQAGHDAIAPVVQAALETLL